MVWGGLGYYNGPLLQQRICIVTVILFIRFLVSPIGEFNSTSSDQSRASVSI